MSEEEDNKNTRQSSINEVGDSISRFASATATTTVKFFNRFVQKTEEVLGTSEVTPLDNTLEMLLARSEIFKNAILELVAYAETLIEPDRLKKQTDMIKNTISPTLEHAYTSQLQRIGDLMQNISQKVPSNTTFWQTLNVCSATFRENGSHELDFYRRVENEFIQPMRELIYADFRSITATRDKLMTARLDLDALKNKVRKNSEDSNLLSECRKVNSQFEVLCLRLQNQLEEFCGSLGQAKLSGLIYILADITKEYHSKSISSFQNIKKP